MGYIIKVDQATAEELWEQLGDIPIDEDECIEEEFIGFQPGTSRYTIWRWFEDTFGPDITASLEMDKKYLVVVREKITQDVELIVEAKDETEARNHADEMRGVVVGTHLVKEHDANITSIEEM